MQTRAVIGFHAQAEPTPRNWFLGTGSQEPVPMAQFRLSGLSSRMMYMANSKNSFLLRGALIAAYCVIGTKKVLNVALLRLRSFFARFLVCRNLAPSRSRNLFLEVASCRWNSGYEVKNVSERLNTGCRRKLIFSMVLDCFFFFHLNALKKYARPCAVSMYITKPLTARTIMHQKLKACPNRLQTRQGEKTARWCTVTYIEGESLMPNAVSNDLERFEADHAYHYLSFNICRGLGKFLGDLCELLHFLRHVAGQPFELARYVRGGLYVRARPPRPWPTAPRPRPLSG